MNTVNIFFKLKKSNKIGQNFGKMKFSKIIFLLIKLIYMWVKGLALLINVGT